MKTWKQGFIGILAVIVLAFVACDDGNGKNNHTHEWGNWIETTAPTCTTAGIETRTCTLDPTHTGTRTGTNAIGHDWGKWVQTSETVETRNCIRSGCTESQTRTPLPPTKEFSYFASTGFNSIMTANKNFSSPAPLSSTIRRRVRVSDTTIHIQTGGGSGPMLVIIDNDGYGWDSNGYILAFTGNASFITVSDFAEPITVYANNGFGWYQATESYYTPEESPFNNGSFGVSFSMTQNWFVDHYLKPYNETTSFTKIYLKDKRINVNVTDVAKNPEEWSISTSDGTLTMKLGTPKDEYLYTFDVFKTFFCDRGGIELLTSNENLKLLELVEMTNIDGYYLTDSCHGDCNPSCGAYLVYANEDAIISGYAYSFGLQDNFDLNLKTGWNIIWIRVSTSLRKLNTVADVFGNHVLWQLYNYVEKW